MTSLSQTGRCKDCHYFYKCTCANPDSTLCGKTRLALSRRCKDFKRKKDLKK